SIRPFIGVPCHRRAADCCGENSTSKEEWNKELGTRHREQHNQRLLFTPYFEDQIDIEEASQALDVARTIVHTALAEES
ncbi:MAG: hypothetical protein V2A73_10335, partial [Pseudomonadota bacterium]